jgi:hypothetical protein
MASFVRTPLTRDLARCPRSLLKPHNQPNTTAHLFPIYRFPAAARNLHTSRPAAAEAARKKQQITVRSGDTSTKRWNELSGAQKVVRTATNSASAATIIVGMVVTVQSSSLLFLRHPLGWQLFSELILLAAGRGPHARLPRSHGARLGYQLVQPRTQPSQERSGVHPGVGGWENQGVWGTDIQSLGQIKANRVRSYRVQGHAE